MIHITSLPSSLAKPLSDYYLPHDSKLFTFSGFYDEETLFSDISKKLKSLEISNDNNQTELETIIYLVEQIQVPHEKKDEFLTRVNWLQRLYKAMADMGSVDTKEKLKQLRNLIAPVQTCPLKIQLMAGLDSLEVSLPDEATVSVEPTVFELLMEKAINEAGDKFFNLGKTGRDYVIAEVLKQEGDHATTAHVQDLAYQLEQRVLTLSEVSDWVEMIAELDQLPLSVFPTL